MRKIIILLIALTAAIIMTAAMPHADTSMSAVRTAAEFVDPDEEFTVTINVRAGDGVLNHVLYERIDEGFTLVGAEPAYIIYNEKDRTVMWTLDHEGNITYILYATEAGSYVFNGNMISVDDGSSLEIEGRFLVNVRDNCTEDWVCGYWSECTGTTQSRECEDKNNCLFPVSRPLMQRDCTIDDDTGDDDGTDAPLTDDEDDGGHAGTGTVTQPSGQDDGNVTIDGQEQIVDAGDDGDADTSEQDDEMNDTYSTDTDFQTDDDEGQKEEQNATITGVEEDETQREDRPENDGGIPMLTVILASVAVIEIVLLANKNSK